MNRQRGFTLVELMVAITLGLLLVAATASVYLGSRSSYLGTTGAADLDDGARFSADFLGRALRGTGFIGCTANNSHAGATTGALITVSGTLSGASNDFGNALSGYEASGTGTAGSVTISTTTGTGTWAPALANDVPTAIGGSDILVVHNTAQTTPVPLPNGFNAGATSVAITPVNGGASIFANQVLAVSDCSKATVFQAQSFAGNSIGTSSTAFTVDYGSGAMIYQPTTSIYYIAPGADHDAALWRYRYNDPEDGPTQAQPMSNIELVPDVENMQILYGYDPGQTLSVTQYTTADNIADFNAVESVQIGLLVASPLNAVSTPAAAPSYQILGTTVTAAAADSRLRRVYTFTVALRDQLP
jgi:type IV pilus assembly protein PilW